MRTGVKPRPGASMPELLVAMLVLLVGIWVVAAKFPKLVEIMRGERTRDQMARLAEQRIEQAREGAEWVPSQITGYDAAAPGPYRIDETLAPTYDVALEPDWDDPLRAPNAIENTLNVIGETFRVPAAPQTIANPDSLYLFREGLAEEVYAVWQPIPLTRDANLNPAAVVIPYPGTFYARDDGSLRFALPDEDPQGNPFRPQLSAAGANRLVANYAWVESPAGGPDRVHWVHSEVVGCWPTDPADLTAPWATDVLDGVDVAGGGIVPDSVTVTYRHPYDVQAYAGAVPPPPAAAPPVCMHDRSFGHALWLNAAEQGKVLQVAYRLRRFLDPADPNHPDNGRRLPLVREVRRVPEDPTDAVSATYSVTLEHRLIDDTQTLFSVDLDGTPLLAQWQNIHVLAFDRETGAVYTDSDGTLTVDYVADATTVPGWEDGKISFPTLTPPAVTPAGRELVVFYRNLDREQVQLQRAPATLVEDIWSAAAPPVPRPSWAAGRWYLPTRDPATASYDPTSPQLLLPDSCLSQTLRVEYLGRGGQTVELHTVGDQAPATLTVDDPVPAAGPNPASARILTVTGVSVRALATWQSRGRLRTASVETLLSAQLDATLAREPHGTVAQP